MLLYLKQYEKPNLNEEMIEIENVCEGSSGSVGDDPIDDDSDDIG